jgi:hypothetical protein
VQDDEDIGDEGVELLGGQPHPAATGLRHPGPQK